MDILIDFAWWAVHGAGFCLGWTVMSAVCGLISSRRPPA